MTTFASAIGTPKKGNGTMTHNTGPGLDTAVLEHGDLVAVHGDEQLPYGGYVDDTFPQLNIVWIRELRTGECRMLSTNECRICLAET
jgi:hypothetical protein